MKPLKRLENNIDKITNILQATTTTNSTSIVATDRKNMAASKDVILPKLPNGKKVIETTVDLDVDSAFK